MPLHIPLDKVGRLITRKALLVLLDRMGGELVLTADEFDSVDGFGVTVKAVSEPPHFVLTLVSAERCDELVKKGVPVA